jgi:NAD(P)-dependent dehydrogenase (short-subunit alcohol dehydrogenase family)
MVQPLRSAIVTGAAQGIGRASAARLLADGFRVAMVDIQTEKLAAAAAESGPDGATLALAGDVTSEADVRRIVGEAYNAFGRIDALVNIAGGSGNQNVKDIEEIGAELWDQVITLNLKSTYLFCAAVVPIMRTQKYGRIVNMSSTLARGRAGPIGTSGARLAYATAKAGILGFTSQLAKDVAEDGITVNAVMPWLTLSEPGTKIRARFEAMDDAGREKILGLHPARRAGRGEEVAAAVAFLASEAASYVSGTGLPVDGAFL